MTLDPDTLVAPETLVAYVDKELPPAKAAAVEAALLHDGAASEAVRLMRLSAASAAHAYDRALSDPLPSRLLETIGAASPAIAPRRPALRLVLPLAASLAALALGLAGGYALRGSGQAGGYVQATATTADPLAAAFESALLPALDSAKEGQVATYGGGAEFGRIEIGGRFSTSFGSECREFKRSETRAGVTSRDSGIACRGADKAWSVMLFPASGS